MLHRPGSATMQHSACKHHRQKRVLNVTVLWLFTAGLILTPSASECFETQSRLKVGMDRHRFQTDTSRR